MAGSASVYPTSLDTTTQFPDPTGTEMDGDGVANGVHSTLHNSLAAAIIALEAKAGITTAKLTRSNTYVVAASNASDRFKNQADVECDGTDDDVQIQAAIDALPSYGGRIILSEGLFTVGASCRLKSASIVWGMGRSRFNPNAGTFVKAKVALNAPVFVLDDEEVTHIELGYMVVSGDKDNQSTGSVIVLDRTGTTLTNAPRDLLHHLQVFDAKENGIVITQPSGAGGGAADLMGVMVSSSGADGFEIAGSDVFATHCISLNNGGKGWDFVTNSSNAQLSNCKADSNTGLGFHISGGSNIKLFGVEALSNTQDGIRINQDDCVISGALFKDNGSTGTPRSAIDITANCQRLVASGLMIRNGTGTAIMDYAVQIASGADHILLDGMASGYHTGKIDDSSGGTVTDRLVAGQ